MHILETIAVSDVEHDNDSLGSFVVGTGDSLEFFLASGVPHLQLHSAALVVDGADFEVDSYGREEGFMEDVISEA